MFVAYYIVLAKTSRCPHLLEWFDFDDIHLFLSFGGNCGFNNKFNTTLAASEVLYFYITPSTLLVQENDVLTKKL